MPSHTNRPSFRVQITDRGNSSNTCPKSAIEVLCLRANNVKIAAMGTKTSCQGVFDGGVRAQLWRWWRKAGKPGAVWLPLRHQLPAAWKRVFIAHRNRQHHSATMIIWPELYWGCALLFTGSSSKVGAGPRLLLKCALNASVWAHFYGSRLIEANTKIGKEKKGWL